MIMTQRTKERRQRRLYAAIAGWALLGAASTGIVACSNADAAGSSAATGSVSVAAGTPSSSSTSSAASSSTAASSATASSAAAASSSAAPSEAAASTAEPATTAAAAETAAASTYADGIYTASGSYSSPGGEESITVTLTLTGDVITGATAVGDATSPPSSQYQEKFVSNFANLIVGKDIDDVSLDKVAGSSLTSGGFNAAVESIKSDALA